MNVIYIYYFFYRIDRFRKESAKGGPPVIYLNAGDTFTGTPWFKVYEEKIVIDFLNALKPDAMVCENFLNLKN